MKRTIRGSAGFTGPWITSTFFSVKMYEQVVQQKGKVVIAVSRRGVFSLDTNRHGLDTRHEYEGAIVMQNSYFIRRAPRKCFFQ